jgi:ADP-ribosyl-[dinitrogen reductase] hydrolase
MDMNMTDRYRGAMLGLAVGDALGTTLEFSPPGSFAPIDDIIGGGPFRLQVRVRRARHFSLGSR